MSFPGEPPMTCPNCEDDFTESACPTCGWEYDGPADDSWIHKAYESQARARQHRREQLRTT